MTNVQDAIEFSRYAVLLSEDDGLTFSRPAGLKSRSMRIQNAFFDSQSIGETNPTRLPSSQTMTIAGEGVVVPTQLGTWRTWAMTLSEKHARIMIDLPAADGGGHYEGRFVVTEFDNVSTKEEGFVTFSVELVSSGVVQWTDAAA
ncbi:hypothetical protein ATO13_08221 [Stappia sp. 22II-S9-Z10]|nr:hypothetical protein ATO13_08221 [Stappia sp. 22II-S9-Z10]